MTVSNVTSVRKKVSSSRHSTEGGGDASPIWTKKASPSANLPINTNPKNPDVHVSFLFLAVFTVLSVCYDHTSVMIGRWFLSRIKDPWIWNENPTTGN